MKTLTTTLLVISMSIATLMTATLYAAEKEHEGTYSSETHEGNAQMQKMDEHMKTMEAQMNAIREEPDLDERKKLMQVHKKSIREGMKMMMQDDGAKGEMGKLKEEIHKAMEGEEKTDVHARMGNMDDHLDMMQQMMEQMMEHQDQYYELEEAYRDLGRDLGS